MSKTESPASCLSRLTILTHPSKKLVFIKPFLTFLPRPQTETAIRVLSVKPPPQDPNCRGRSMSWCLVLLICLVKSTRSTARLALPLRTVGLVLWVVVCGPGVMEPLAGIWMGAVSTRKVLGTVPRGISFFCLPPTPDIKVRIRLSCSPLRFQVSVYYLVHTD